MPIWSDFHARLIRRFATRLNPRLPKRYIASTEIFVWRVAGCGRTQLVLRGPDITLPERKRPQVRPAVAALAAPITTILPGIDGSSAISRSWIATRPPVVTVIEILSPANKTGGDDGRAYLLKREEYIGSGISLVEIDLLRRPASAAGRPGTRR